jgi:hypothetical protein
MIVSANRIRGDTFLLLQHYPLFRLGKGTTKKALERVRIC